MADNQGAKRAAQPEKNESVFFGGMIGVGNQKRLLVEKDGLRLGERYPVLAPILRVLAVIPLKLEHIQPPLQCTYNVMGGQMQFAP